MSDRRDRRPRPQFQCDDATVLHLPQSGSEPPKLILIRRAAPVAVVEHQQIRASQRAALRTTGQGRAGAKGVGIDVQFDRIGGPGVRAAAVTLQDMNRTVALIQAVRD